MTKANKKTKLPTNNDQVIKTLLSECTGVGKSIIALLLVLYMSSKNKNVFAAELQQATHARRILSFIKAAKRNELDDGVDFAYKQVEDFKSPAEFLNWRPPSDMKSWQYVMDTYGDTDMATLQGMAKVANEIIVPHWSQNPKSLRMLRSTLNIIESNSTHSENHLAKVKLVMNRVTDIEAYKAEKVSIGNTWEDISIGRDIYLEELPEHMDDALVAGVNPFITDEKYLEVVAYHSKDFLFEPEQLENITKVLDWIS